VFLRIENPKIGQPFDWGSCQAIVIEVWVVSTFTGAGIYSGTKQAKIVET